MKAGEWAHAWGHGLIHARPEERSLPATARDFLVSFGLPRVVIFEWRNSFEISFSPLEKDLVLFNTLVTWGDFYNEARDREWNNQLVIGEEDFCNGDAAYCVQKHDGTVSRIDCQLLHEPNCFVNSSIEQFGMSLLIAQKWSAAVHSGGALPDAESFDKLACDLKRGDPRAFENPKCFWPNLIEAVLENPDEDPLDLEITSDPRRSKARF